MKIKSIKCSYDECEEVWLSIEVKTSDSWKHFEVELDNYQEDDELAQIDASKICHIIPQCSQCEDECDIIATFEDGSTTDSAAEVLKNMLEEIGVDVENFNANYEPED